LAEVELRVGIAALCERAPDGDCSAVICRVCGTPLERIDDLGVG